MDCDEWAAFLEDLVGHGSNTQGVHLLAPKHGSSDLSQDQADDLAEAIHRRLFKGNPPQVVLKHLATRPPQESLPLLYFCAWLARQQENRIAFWPYFARDIVRNKIPKQKVHQVFAALISDLWWNMHNKWNIYRPLEGRVHVKWPQAHAGLTEKEVAFLSNILVKSAGWSEEPPAILSDDPDEFLGQVRISLQQELHAPPQLQKILTGPDGPALVVAELAQNLIREHWPPTRVDAPSQRLHALPPYIVLNCEPLSLSVILPEGELKGETLLHAKCGEQGVQLVTSYFEQALKTRYSSYVWPVAQIPWPRDVILTYGDSSINMKIKPECPFRKGRSAALMFEAATGKHVMRWRPLSQYFLVLTTGELPSWVYLLFIDVEMINLGQIADQDLQVISAVGRDLTANFTRQEASDLLRKLEDQIARYGALISLPHLDDIFKPTISLRGGTLVSGEQNPVYLVNSPPSILVQNIYGTALDISVNRRYDDGSELCFASASSQSGELRESLFLQIPGLEQGYYVIRGIGQPQYFSLVAESPQQLFGNMEVRLKLLHAEDIVARDDLRHFQYKGIEISSWPYATITLNVHTEAGTRSYRLQLNDAGVKIIRADEIELPTSTRWARLEAVAWLAHSETLDLTVRPYVLLNQWTLKNNDFSAKVMGVNPKKSCQLVLVPMKPWNLPVLEVTGVINPDCSVQYDLGRQYINVWIILTDPAHEAVWFMLNCGHSIPEYDFAAFHQSYEHDFSLPLYISGIKSSDRQFREMCCLVELGHLTRHASIPFDTEPIPEYLMTLMKSQNIIRSISVKLPPTWGQQKAAIELSAAPPCRARLVIDNRQFDIRVISIGSEVELVWADISSPCICGGCGRLMTQMGWHSHKCEGDKESLKMLPNTFTPTLYVDWPTVLGFVKQAVLNEYRIGSSKGPKGLEEVYTNLQAAFRNRPKTSQQMSPDKWVDGSVSGWCQLFNILNDDEEKTTDWIAIHEQIMPFESGVIGLSTVFR